MGILLRTFLDSFFSCLLLTSFLAPCTLKFYPLTSFFDFVFSFYPSSSLYLRFCVSILFCTFFGFGIFSLLLLFRSLSSVLLCFFFLLQITQILRGHIILVLQRLFSPLFLSLLYDPVLNSLKILRGHIVPHFLGRTHSFFSSIFVSPNLLSLPFIFFHFPTFLLSLLLLSCDSAWTYCSALSQDTSYLPILETFFL